MTKPTRKTKIPSSFSSHAEYKEAMIGAIEEHVRAAMLV